MFELPFCCSVDNVVDVVFVNQKSATYVDTYTPNSVKWDNGLSLSKEKWVLE